MVGDPFLDVGMRRWLLNSAKRNFWRVAPWYDLDDLIQDAYLCFYTCRARYVTLTEKDQPSDEDKRRFMAIIKVAFTNHVNILARRKGPEVLVAELSRDGESMDSTLERYAGAVEGEAMLLWSLTKAPQELLTLLDFIASDDSKFKRYPRNCRRYLRETTNEHFGRLVGYDPAKGNAVAYAEEYFA